MLQSVWKGCSLHGNKADVFQLGASQSLLNTCFSPTWDSLTGEMRQARKSFIKLGPKYLRFTFFTFTFLDAGQVQYWSTSSRHFLIQRGHKRGPAASGVSFAELSPQGGPEFPQVAWAWAVGTGWKTKRLIFGGTQACHSFPLLE